ncbi:hypothetical protein RhiirA1_529427 [Rhizophagus irregularis]|uniref:Protein kinase domain-containing protein n=1 Tax=Rhizophagus irregularis TaxID=588596 RepID=A0A2I1EDE0_9GLOM|nr:hypothetical protein RhiirA1_529427 [Rhizophagus irregularis]PKY20140.1 hypothetical protein RhiirB3_524078 [Rhizophagus irregularis]
MFYESATIFPDIFPIESILVLMKKIVHLDLRSANILLKYDENEKTLMPKISNFLWSRDFYSGKTSAYPTIIISSGEEVWKRWYDSERLSNMRQFQIPTTSADIYSLGLLFWEIAWCKPRNLPFKEVSIEKLYHHLRQYNHENLPELPVDYQHWRLLISKMWKFKAEDRCDINTVEMLMQRLYKGRSDSTSSVSSPISPTSPSNIFN